MKPTFEQREAVADNIRLLIAAGTPLDGVAQIVWENISCQVLEEAARECDLAMGEAQRAETFIAQGSDLVLEQLEYARRKGAEKCAVRIRAMK